jgi:hypothetical protein
MRKLLLAAALILALPTASQAQFGLGLRVGYGVPGGDLVKNDKYTDHLKSQMPFQVDLMFRTSPTTAGGIYLGYAVNTIAGPAKDLCTLQSLSCSSNTLRAGIQFTGELLNLGMIGLWGGVGTGFEAANFTGSGGGNKIETQYRGWEWATISAGADLHPLPLISVGLFASYGFGQFRVEHLKITSGLVTAEGTNGIGADKATHNMFQIGLRGMFTL